MLFVVCGKLKYQITDLESINILAPERRARFALGAAHAADRTAV